MAQYAAQFIEADGFRVECKKTSATDWSLIPGVADWTVSGGEAPTRAETDLNASFNVTGRSETETVSFTVAGLQPGHSSYGLLREAYTGDSDLQFRWQKSEEKVLFPTTAAGVTLSIATDGSVTAAGTATAHPQNINDRKNPIGPGSAIKIGTAYYYIDDVDSSGMIGDVTIANPPGTVVAASVYSIVQPPLHQPAFLARVTAFPHSGAQSGSLSGTFTLAPYAALPALKSGTP